MLKPIKRWLLDNSLLVAVLTSVLIIILSLIPPSIIPNNNIKVSDKFLHTIAYLGLSWVWLLVFRKKTTSLKFIILLVLVLFGMILELTQEELTSYRTADWYDVIANTVGIFIGFISFKFMYSFVFFSEEKL